MFCPLLDNASHPMTAQSNPGKSNKVQLMHERELNLDVKQMTKAK